MPSNHYPIFYGSLIVFLVWNFNKSNKKNKPRDIMLNISLAVLDDLGKEINQGYADAIKEAAAIKISKERFALIIINKPINKLKIGNLRNP